MYVLKKLIKTYQKVFNLFASTQTMTIINLDWFHKLNNYKIKCKICFFKNRSNVIFLRVCNKNLFFNCKLKIIL